jgi:MAF protein
MPKFILGSQSPRRRALFGLLGVPFDVRVADVDEESVTHPDPAVNVVETAVLKTTTLAQLIDPAEHTILITADTTVALGQTMLGKPRDAVEARDMLLQLRNRTHEVHTGLVLLDNWSGQLLRLANRSVVTMRPYSEAEMAAYIATGDPLDKAGAYAIQHPVFQPVAHLDGCFTGVMGLPVCQLIQAFDQWKLPRRVDLTAVSHVHAHYPCPFFDSLTTASSY